MDIQVAPLLLQYVALLLALCVHEFTHAALARFLGDPTAEDEGRLTLNPLAHVDPFGTVLLPLIGMLTAFPLFGWAKPVPVQPANFRRGWFGKGQVLVAAGGPISNTVQALLWVIAFAVLTHAVSPLEAVGTPFEVLGHFIQYSVVINLILAAFNLLPIPPLDGAHVASWGLPRRLAVKYDAVMEPYGMWILILAFPLLGFLLWPALKLGHVLLQLAGGRGW